MLVKASYGWSCSDGRRRARREGDVMKKCISLVGRVSLSLLLSAAVAVTAPAQSGRCMIEGYVVGESHYDAIAGAKVELVRDEESSPRGTAELSVMTDVKGKYSLKGVLYGDYTLRVSAPGYVPYRIKIYMLSDATTQLHVRLRKERSSDRMHG
jgi:hypothetical protein